MAVKKDEKTGKWFYYGKYTDIYGETHQYKKRGFRTKSEAKSQEQIFLSSSKDVGNQCTLDELLEDYISYNESRKKKTSLYNDRRNYNAHVKESLGKKKINRITTKDIINLHNHMIQKGYSVNYINTIHGVISKLFNYAIKLKGFNNNPASKVGFVMDKNTVKEKMSIWTYNDFQKFISVVDDERYKLAYTLAYMSGARRGELLALTWDDYDGKGININKTCSKIEGGYIITPPKTSNSVRYVELDSMTIEMLNAYKEDVKDYELFNNDWFILGHDRPMSFTRIRERMNTYITLSEVPKIRFHDIRHSHASLLINNGMKITAIARRLGHSTEMLLQVYSHFFKENEKEITDFLQNIQKSMPKVCQNENDI